MSYDEPDPPEPTEDEIQEGQAHNAALGAPIRIEGLTLASVEATIRGLIRSNYDLDRRIAERLDAAVEEHVAALVAETTKERIAAAVDAAIAEGFATFDRYNGRETGRTSVAEMVHKALSERAGSSGFREEGTLAEAAVRKAVKSLFDEQLANVMKALVADFKKQADGVFQAKIVAGMKEALGLRS